MFPRWWRLGIRPQLTIIVILGAIFSTVATLYIADSAISSYVLNQARTQEKENMKIARLVLQTQYGQNVSIASDGTMVADLPTAGKDFNLNSNNDFGRYALDQNTDYVDGVQQLIGGTVSIFKCANAQGDFTPCTRIETTLRGSASPGQVAPRATGEQLPTVIGQSDHMDLTGNGSQAHEWLGVDTVDGVQYFTDYAPIFNPDGRWIGVLFVGVPLDSVTSLVSRTTIELVIIGTIIMVAAVILALIFANTVIATLQRAARQVSGASERIGLIADQQASGSAQQVWAINAINQALQNFSETARDISQRTDQLALMGNQVLQRRQEISPTQIDSILAYITRSVRDISVASRQQAAQYERMTGAMQAVIEIAEQVAGNSQQSTESSERLDLVVRQLQQLVGVRIMSRRDTTGNLGLASVPDLASAAASRSSGRGTVRAVRPSARRRAQDMAQLPAANAGRMGAMMAPANAGFTNPADQMGMVGAPAGGGERQRMGRMAIAGGPGNAGGAGGMRADGNASMAGRMRLGPSVGSEYGMQTPMSGPRMGARGGGSQGYDMPDWRLPPLPEMGPLPDWGGPQLGEAGGAGRMRGMPSGDPQWPSAPAQHGRGMQGDPGGAPGGNNDPYGTERSGPNGGWPRNRGQ
jgi:hypothetical protein